MGGEEVNVERTGTTRQFGPRLTRRREGRQAGSVSIAQGMQN